MARMTKEERNEILSAFAEGRWEFDLTGKIGISSAKKTKAFIAKVGFAQAARTARYLVTNYEGWKQPHDYLPKCFVFTFVGKGYYCKVMFMDLAKGKSVVRTLLVDVHISDRH